MNEFRFVVEIYQNLYQQEYKYIVLLMNKRVKKDEGTVMEVGHD